MVVNYEEGTQARKGARRGGGRGRGKNQRGGGARTVALRRSRAVGARASRPATSPDRRRAG